MSGLIGNFVFFKSWIELMGDNFNSGGNQESNGGNMLNCKVLQNGSSMHGTRIGHWHLRRRGAYSQWTDNGIKT